MSRELKDEGDDGFLSRWSKRKRAEPEPEPDVVAEPEAEAAALEEKLEEKTDQEILEELGLPDPDALREGDDFSGFMKGAVPTRLRNRALRKLWLTNPVLANIDELVDYGEDFTDAATVIENMQTAYQVGKGWLPDEPEDVQEAAEAEAAGEEATGEEAAGEEAAETAEADDTATENPAQDETEPALPSDEKTVMTSQDQVLGQAESLPAAQDRVATYAAEAEPVPAAPRRMQFRFGDS